MRLRNIGFLMVTLVAGACGTAADNNVNESVDQAKKSDAGHKCHSVALAEQPGCGKAGKSDAGKGRSDADDDDDDDDDGEDGGKK
jgi:hypothetical protein